MYPVHAGIQAKATHSTSPGPKAAVLGFSVLSAITATTALLSAITSAPVLPAVAPSAVSSGITS
ncbi:hypothetical protein PIB30_069278, partial [Stylosanthes scabra]|nr:hypothetical protein [Stylosanthes scabra]